MRETECAGNLFVLSTVERKIGYAQNQTAFQRQNRETFYLAKFPNVSDFFYSCTYNYFPLHIAKKKRFYIVRSMKANITFINDAKRKKIKSESNLI